MKTSNLFTHYFSRMFVYICLPLLFAYGISLALVRDNSPLIVIQRNITLSGKATDIFRLIQDIDSHKKWSSLVQNYETDDFYPVSVGKRYVHTAVLPIIGTVQREMMVVEMAAPYYMSYVQDTWLLPRVDMTIVPLQEAKVRFTWTMSTQWNNLLLKHTVLPIVRLLQSMSVNQAMMKLSIMAEIQSQKKHQTTNVDAVEIDPLNYQ